VCSALLCSCVWLRILVHFKCGDWCCFLREGVPRAARNSTHRVSRLLGVFHFHRCGKRCQTPSLKTRPTESYDSEFFIFIVSVLGCAAVRYVCSLAVALLDLFGRHINSPISLNGFSLAQKLLLTHRGLIYFIRMCTPQFNSIHASRGAFQTCIPPKIESQLIYTLNLARVYDTQRSNCRNTKALEITPY